MKLYLERRGCNFTADYPDTQSDMTNFRLFMEFIDRDGKRVCGDVGRCDVREFYTTRASNTKCRILSPDGLHFDLQYECYSTRYHDHGTFGYVFDVPQDARYTQADTLRVVNSFSAVQYEAVEIVDELPPEAHDYPPFALELEQQYLARQRAAEVADTREWLADGCMHWLNEPGNYAADWARHLTPDDVYNLTRDACTIAFEHIASYKNELIVKACGKNLDALYRWLFTEQKHFRIADHPAFLRLLYEEYPDRAALYVPTLDADTVTL